MVAKPGMNVSGGKDPGEMILLGRITATFGIKGWVKIFSHTEDRAGIADYNPWHLLLRGKWLTARPLEARLQGKGVVARIEGVDDCDTAEGYIGAEIHIRRDQLPAAKEGEVYWIDLEGLRVVNAEGEDLGVVDYLFDCGANDVLVVKGDRERLIPYVRGQVVTNVDLEAGVLTVDWDKDF